MLTLAQSSESRLEVSERDRRILQLAARNAGTSDDLGAALHALAEAVRLVIPAGRIFHLGEGDEGPVVGSIVSGVGLTVTRRRVLVVRRTGSGGFTTLALLASLAKEGP